MLTVDNHKAILDRSTSEEIKNDGFLQENTLYGSTNVSTYVTVTPTLSTSPRLNISCDSLNDDALLKRKHEWASVPKIDNSEGFLVEDSILQPSVSQSNLGVEAEQNDLERIILTEGNTSIASPLSKDKEPILSEFSGAYSPKQPDTLFWSIFIIANGYGEYLNIARNYGVKELEIKKKVCDFLQKNPSKLKHTNYKITKAGVQEVISELLTSNKETSFNCLLALCVYYNINIVLLHSNGKLMLEFLSYDQEETPYYILKKDTYGKYSVDTDKKTWKEVQEMKTQFICIVNYMKPMKASGHYKMEDLEELAVKMGLLDTTKKYKKAELYQTVNDKLNWFT